MVKLKITEALVLTFSDFKRIFKVNCSASDVGIGSVLS